MNIIIKEVQLTDQEAADILTTAIESNGIQYWACNFGKIIILRSRKFDDCIIKATIKADREDGLGEPATYEINLATIKKAINLAVQPECSVRSSIVDAVLKDDFDSEDCDNIIQLACFGEVIYG